MSVDVKVSGDSFGALVKKLQRPEDLLNKIGEYLVSTTRARISSTKTSPDGAPWQPWSPATAMARAKSGTSRGGLLYNSGRLYNSIQHRVMGNDVQISSDAPYAGFLQQGTSRMPARPFLGISLDDKQALSGLVRRHFRA